MIKTVLPSALLSFSSLRLVSHTLGFTFEAAATGAVVCSGDTRAGRLTKTN